MANTRKQIAFDLDTKQLKNYYPKMHWESAYADIKNHMKANRFQWQQGSLHVFEKTMSGAQLAVVIEALIEKIPG